MRLHKRVAALEGVGEPVPLCVVFSHCGEHADDVLGRHVRSDECSGGEHIVVRFVSAAPQRSGSSLGAC